MRDNFNFSQKLSIITKRLPTLKLVNSHYGIFECPLCYKPMALGFETKEDGNPYEGNNNYQKIHKDLGFRIIPSWLKDISRIEIDHINCCLMGGRAHMNNGWLICKDCNRTCSGKLSEKDKENLYNGIEHMEEDGEYKIEGNKVNLYFNGKLVRSIKDPMFVISKRREQSFNIGSPMEID